MAGRGAFSSTILKCTDAFDTLDKCEMEFLRRFAFKKYDILGDGNCFYRALAKYYELSSHSALPKDYHKELRDIVVLKMCEDIDKVKQILVINNNSNDPALKDAAYQHVLDDLRKDGRWNADNADPVHEYAAIALNRRIRIFNKTPAINARKIRGRRLDNGTYIYNDRPAKNAEIICYIFNEEKKNMGTIDLLRIGNSHYELLYPEDPTTPDIINATIGNSSIYVDSPPTSDAPRLTTILAAKSPVEKTIANNCLRPLLKPTQRITAKSTSTKKGIAISKPSTALNITSKKLSPVEAKYEQNLEKAITASLKSTPSTINSLAATLTAVNLKETIPIPSVLSSSNKKKSASMIIAAKKVKEAAILRKKATEAKEKTDAIKAALASRVTVKNITKGLSVTNVGKRVTRKFVNTNSNSSNNEEATAIEEQRKLLEYFKKLKKNKNKNTNKNTK